MLSFRKSGVTLPYTHVILVWYLIHTRDNFTLSVNVYLTFVICTLQPHDTQAKTSLNSQSILAVIQQKCISSKTLILQIFKIYSDMTERAIEFSQTQFVDSENRIIIVTS